MTEIKPITKKHKGDKMKIQMPESLGGEIYECMDHIPHRVNMQLNKANKEDDEEKALEIITINLIIDPKITKEYLYSDDCDGLKIMLLTEKLMKELNINEERVIELKKELVRL